MYINYQDKAEFDTNQGVIIHIHSRCGEYEARAAPVPIYSNTVLCMCSN